MQCPQKPSAVKIILVVLLVYGISAIIILLFSSMIGFWLNGSEGASFAVGIGVMINLLVFPMVGYVLIARLRSLSETPPPPSENSTEQQEGKETE
ncbi:MAG: hypothetical protein GX415_05805 [Chloroflexi bacterium]|jgi:hypothetical protein|nr:hypothetical protein [Anaerolineaceae bacterium]NLI44909.1 hypothetical protein [Chloroflexota bacterium]HOE34924.1 hypothetical protein [Anaerolineaceae bacterium]HOT26202.1 hypothetical protein [Anaerolineaceae bacterium]HQK03847.1 hypothetical protein [Anaerolineaceae bacterium]